jgi:hypothetical protein
MFRFSMNLSNIHEFFSHIMLKVALLKKKYINCWYSFRYDRDSSLLSNDLVLLLLQKQRS